MSVPVKSTLWVHVTAAGHGDGHPSIILCIPVGQSDTCILLEDSDAAWSSSGFETLQYLRRENFRRMHIPSGKDPWKGQFRALQSIL